MTVLYRDTEIETCRAMPEMRATLAHALPHLQWRHHGIGVLQAYLQEGDVETRAHIWHPDLVRVAPERQIHSHRFNLRSTVLVGTLHHDEYRLRASGEIGWQRWSVLPARQGSEPPTKVGEPVAVEVIDGAIPAGDSYTFRRGAFHRSHVGRLAVTLMVKTDQIPDHAEILVRLGTNPAHGFADTTPTDITRFVSMAVAALRREG